MSSFAYKYTVRGTVSQSAKPFGETVATIKLMLTNVQFAPTNYTHEVPNVNRMHTACPTACRNKLQITKSSKLQML